MMRASDPQLSFQCRNKLSATGAEALCRLMIRRPQLLVDLDLEANRILDDGAKALGAVLQHVKTLKT
eukprot:42450-Eustigmatos_ZCMA.PRE.1